MKARAFNPQVFLETLCYSVFAGLMLYLVNSGKYLSYVTPRMEPYLYFTAIVMGIWALAGLAGLFRPQHKIRSAHCFVLAIPILLLLLPHSPLKISNLSGNYVGGNAFSGITGQSAYESSDEKTPSGDTGLNAEADIPDEDPAGSGIGSEDEYSDDLPGLDAENKRIAVSNDDFGLWLSEIYMHMEKYKGYTVVMTGFVLKDTEMLKEDEFVPARLMMSCCVADLAPVGLLCKYDKASELKADSWVTVEGTLFVGKYEYDGQVYDDPQLSVTKIIPAEEVEGYVYP
ncbi:MAG: TIGR03943 family protein [Clostridiaceae bacterium]|nr:TIGR03943 family protein [Clostridiaceae bacterium]